MLKQVNLTSCIGKTIKGVANSYNRQIAIAFEDGTFVNFRVLHSEHDSLISQTGIDLSRHSSKEIISSGIITREEYDSIILEQEALKELREKDKATAELRRILLQCPEFKKEI